MNKHAIVILYSGKDQDPGYDTIEAIANVITQAGLSVPELIEIKHFDSDSVARAIVGKAISVEVPMSKSETGNSDSKISLRFVAGPNKIRVVKFLKDEFHISLKEAKDAADAGVIMIPSPVNFTNILIGLCEIGAYAIDLSDEMALKQAVIYINKRYQDIRNSDNIIDKIFPDAIKATNMPDDYSKALLESINLIAKASLDKCRECGLTSEFYDAVCRTHIMMLKTM